MKTKHMISSHEGGEHRIVYQDWGREDNPQVLLCVHGLTRNSHDFDYLAKKLSAQYRVIAPDIVGRGASDWLSDHRFYTIEQYIKDMSLLIQHLEVTSIDWLGTSLGGIIGMLMAAMPQSPIRRLVLNDIGALVTQDAIALLAQSLAKIPNFKTLEELQVFLKQAYAHTGQLEDADYVYMSQYDHRIAEDGTYARNYDPQLLHSMGPALDKDIDLWHVWKAINCPTLIIHGETSMILTAEICEKMLATNPQASLVTLPGVGHTPSFMQPSHIEVVERWLMH